MLHEQPWIKFADDLEIELMQCEDEGKNTDGLREQIEKIKAMAQWREEAAAELLDEMRLAPVRSGFLYDEPSDYPAIKKASCKINLESKISLDDDEYYDRVYGVWLGRCAGCLLGQPVEGWKRENIVGLLNDTGNLPVTHYISSNIDNKIREKYNVNDEGGPYGAKTRGWINNVSCMPEDDDINYTLISLILIQKYGVRFTPEDVLECWLEKLPYLHTCTAERAAYRNAASLMMLPATASYRNPYREYIGAQIRADLYGYVCPSEPQKAAEMAYRDACVPHVKNGIYGAMFVAAMISAAAVCPDVGSVIQTGLAVVPRKSRLAAGIQKVISWKSSGKKADEMANLIHEEFDESNPYHWCHVIPNAMIVCVSLLCGDGDLDKIFGIALETAFDTDCNCATAGSVAGMMAGSVALPEKWIAPLKNRIISGVDGFGSVKISRAAGETLLASRKIQLEWDRQ
jgi:ADP-ribosylglycohydrolase